MTGLLSKSCVVNQSKTIIHIYLSNNTYKLCQIIEIFFEHYLLIEICKSLYRAIILMNKDDCCDLSVLECPLQIDIYLFFY